MPVSKYFTVVVRMPEGEADKQQVEAALKALEPFRAAKNKSVAAAITLHAPADDAAVLQRHHAELADIFIVSGVTVVAASEASVSVAAHTGPKCDRCWKHFDVLAVTPADVCQRCATALAAKGITE